MRCRDSLLAPLLAPWLARLAPLLVAASALTAATAQSGWSTPVLEAPLNSFSSDTAPHLSSHGLVAHFASFRGGDWAIYSSARATRSSPWAAPALEGALNDANAADTDPFLAADGLGIYFASTRAGGQGGYDLMHATRHSPSAAWTVPVFVTVLNSASNETAPSLTEDELEIYFVTNGLGATSSAIARAVRTSAANPFGAPALVPELLSPEQHRDVHVSLDGLTLHYTRLDSLTQRYVVLTATRTDRAAAFGTPRVLNELAGVGPASGVAGFAVSREGNEALLAAGFVVGAGAQEIMTARFDGLTADGIASTGSTMDLYYRDGAHPGAAYALALAAGNTGFPLGSRWVPLDPDPLFAATLGVSIPTLSGGFLGVLDAGGEAAATLTNPLPALAGVRIWAGGFTFDATAPFGVATIADPLAVELQL